MLLADAWEDYALLDTGDGEKLERWGSVRVIRPDPQILWPRTKAAWWREADLHYHRSASGGGHWEILTDKGVSGDTARHESWSIAYKNLRFLIKPTDFKHMGLFPEQAVNWDWAMGLIQQRIARQNANRQTTEQQDGYRLNTPQKDTVQQGDCPIKVLNLFGYTGGATVACLQAGADVTHVDAAKGMNQWAKENIALSGLQQRPHRVLTDDVMKFLRREARRGRRYDAVIMDPPAFGRGPSGELWKLSERLFELVEACVALLSEKPLFMLLNAYTAGFSPTVAENIIHMALTARRAGGDELSTTAASRRTDSGAAASHRADNNAVASRRVNCEAPTNYTGLVTSGEIGLKAEAGGMILPCGLFGRWEAPLEMSLR